MHLLAYAERTDLFSSDWSTILLVVALIIGAVILSVLPFALARHRGHRQSHVILVAMILWGLLAGGSTVLTAMTQVQWSKEQLLLMKTGYYDPASAAGAPAWPWPFWCVLAAGYVGFLIYSLAQKMPPGAGFPIGGAKPPWRGA